MDADPHPARILPGPVSDDVIGAHVGALSPGDTVRVAGQPFVVTDVVAHDFTDAHDVRITEHFAQPRVDDDQPDGEHGDIDALRVGYTRLGRPGRRGHTRRAR